MKNGSLNKRPLEKTTNVIKDHGKGYGKAFAKSLIEQNKDIYLPGGALTVGCVVTVEVLDNDDYSIMQDKIAATKTNANLLEEYFDTNNQENLDHYNSFSDFQIICQNNEKQNGSTTQETLQCHKIILAIGSPVFNAMFSHQTKEMNENRVEVKDLSSDTLRKMLHFLYTGTLPGSMVEKELLIAADKYQIPRLKAICEKELAETQNNHNAFDIAILADVHGSKEFQGLTTSFVTKHWKTISQEQKLIGNLDIMLKLLDKTCG